MSSNDLSGVAASQCHCLWSEQDKPVFEAARELHDAQKKGSILPAVSPAASETAADSSAANPAGTEASPQAKDAAGGAGAEPKPAESKPAEIVLKKSHPGKQKMGLAPRPRNTKGGLKRPFPKED